MKTSFLLFLLCFGLSRIAASQQDSAISYYSASLPHIDFFTGENYNSSVTVNIAGRDSELVLGAIAFGESFHLPAASGGFVDSISIGIDSTTADTIFIALVPAWTRYTNPFYTPDIDTEYFRTIITDSDLSGKTRITIPTNHTNVQQDFTVVIRSDSNTKGIINRVALRADNEQAEIRTANNTRSNFLSNLTYANGEPVLEVVDSVLIPNGFTSPIYSNLDITAYVSQASAGIAEPQIAESVSLYPNPASNVLNLPTSMNATSVELVDQLGRTMLSQNIEGNSRVDVSQLPPGNYEAVVHASGGIQTAPVVIQR